jgi:hypothetical protein
LSCTRISFSNKSGIWTFLQIYASS